MREFPSAFKNLGKGLRAFKNVPMNEDSLVECYNLAPAEAGLEIHEALTSLNADGVTWGGEGIKAAPTLTRDISINIKDYVSEEILEGAAIYLDTILKGTTDVNGNLTIEDVTIGGHFLKITKAGYVDSDADVLYNDYIMVI